MKFLLPRKGSVLVFSLIILSFLLVSALSVATLAITEQKTAGTTDKSSHAFQIADSGVEIMLKKIYKGNYASQSLGSLGSSCSNGAISDASNTYKVTFYDSVGTKLTDCADTAWRNKVAKIKSEGTYGNTIRAVESGVKAADLSGHWKFDEGSGPTAADSSGNNNSGTLTDGAAWAPAPDKALSLNGSSSPYDYVRVADSESLDFASGSKITISAWVYPTNTTGYRTFLAKGRDTDNAEANYALRQDSSGKKIEFYYNESGGTTWSVWRTTSDQFLSTDRWYHVVFTYTFGTSASAQMYVDGASAGGSWVTGIGLGTGTAAPDVSAQALLIGKITAGEAFSGKLDEIRIYDRILTASEVSALYDQGH